jgi:hypothetical protein
MRIVCKCQTFYKALVYDDDDDDDDDNDDPMQSRSSRIDYRLQNGKIR